MLALSPVMFWATACVAIVAGPTIAAIPNAATITTAIKNSFVFIAFFNLEYYIKNFLIEIYRLISPRNMQTVSQHITDGSDLEGLLLLLFS